MNHIKMLERFEQAGSAKIDQLFWIAGSIENSDLVSLLEDFEDDHWEILFPEIFKSEHFEHYKTDREDLFGLITFQKFGFLAEAHIPICTRFSFDKKGNPESWQTGGSSHIAYAYADTPEALIKCIEIKAKELHKQDIERFKRKEAKNA